MNKKKHSIYLLVFTTLLLAGSFFMTACAPAIPGKSTAQPTGIDPTAVSLPAATATPETADATTTPSITFTLDSSGLASGLQEESLAPVSGSDDTPYWEVLPSYIRLTLKDYAITKHVMQPQIFIYPVQEFVTINKAAGKEVDSLQSLIASPHEIPEMPLLPLFNLKSVMHTHVQYLDFKSGHGLRYLTLLGQGIMPINNRNLIYVYQGLTQDRKYYVAAVLPLNHSSLPADETITGNEPAEFTSDYSKYVNTTAAALNTQTPESFTPDLTRLDAMMSSLEIH
jgi:hypothetical protein